MTLLILSTSNSFSQQKSSTNLSEFIITISQNENSILLESSDGCAWKELKFDTQKEQGIDNFGISNSDASDNDLKFYFTLVRTKTGLKLKGIKGTTWKELSFTVEKNKKYEITKSGVKSS